MFSAGFETRERRFHIAALFGAAGRNNIFLAIGEFSDASREAGWAWAHDDLLVLEREIAHHYGLLARRVTASPNPRSLALEVLVPAEARKLPVAVEGEAADTLAFDERRIAATRYDLRIGEQRTALWVDDAGGRLLRVAVPDRGWSAIREDLE